METKLVQRFVYSSQHYIDVSLSGDIGYITITDNGLYPNEDSKTHKRNLGFNSTKVLLMTREDLTDLKVAIEEVLKTSKYIDDTTHKFVCSVCGGDNIESRRWTDPNTKEFTDSCVGTDETNNWCNNCKSFVTFKTIEINE